LSEKSHVKYESFSQNREVQKCEIGSQEELTFYIESFITTLESKIPRLLENEHIFEMINKSKDQKAERKDNQVTVHSAIRKDLLTILFYAPA
jgi:hypothetical protein